MKDEEVQRAKVQKKFLLTSHRPLSIVRRQPSTVHFSLLLFLPRQNQRQGFDKTCIGEHPIYNLVFAFGI
jgi:hypothetical protein